MRRLLERINFQNPSRVSQLIRAIERTTPQEVQAGMRSLLVASPDPEQALYMLGRLQEERPDAFRRLTSSVAGLPFLITVFSYSRFLSEAVLRNPEWLEELLNAEDLERVRSMEEYRQLLENLLEEERFLDPDAGDRPSTAMLARFRRRQLLRILIRDAQNYCTLAETVEELSNLADAILEVSCRTVRSELCQRYGAPLVRNEDGAVHECSFAVFSLGKLGGRELNYSSDIDLMFMYEGQGETTGPAVIENHDFYRRFANRVIELLSEYSPEGRCYRVDLRLRPEGRTGDVCLSLDAMRNYYLTRARDWELQMLIKARVSAGDHLLGRTLLDAVEPRVYSTTLNFSAIESMSATRERLSEKLAARSTRQAGFNIKLARGGIRDIEFLVQCLQRLHGGREPWVRYGGTLLALFRLRDKNLLSDAEYSRLASAYQFLRILEHRLQCADDAQTHELPVDPAELEILARKMPASELGGPPSADLLLRRLNQHLEEVQDIYERVVHAQQPLYYEITTASDGIERITCDQAAVPSPVPASNLIRFLDQKAPGLAAVLQGERLLRSRKQFEHFLELILPQPPLLELLDRDAETARRVIDIFEHSPYFADQLIRTPELLEQMLRLQEPAGPVPYGASAEDLRRYFQREMFRIQAESICLSAPIFDTLERTSELADTVIRAAYDLAITQTAEAGGLASSSLKPAGQLMAIALGRLGMREFDLASDADLIFVLADEEADNLPFWTRVAERLIEILTAYTGAGMIFAVDTRLRPNGREGPLVQLESGYREYFTRSAQAWEGITYMKSRAVAGDLERATEFLHSLQDLDWRRYGQGGRSRKALAEMRMRLEREQGRANPLKAGRGGYYDIDFALMYLRLKGAGIFYKVLNTPARIDVLEKMGHLEPADAEFLRDAAVFYRAVDHALRVSTGHTEGDLPSSPAQLENLSELVRRWTPEHLHDQPLDVELAQIQARTREFFNRLFG